MLYFKELEPQLNFLGIICVPRRVQGNQGLTSSLKHWFKSIGKGERDFCGKKSRKGPINPPTDNKHRDDVQHVALHHIS